MMSFNQLSLNSHVLKALHACGYKEPTPIQARSIPDILHGKDIVASAQTGTGKTAAFVLPALHRLSQSQAGAKPRVLILTPTRELAAQIGDAITKYGKFMRINTVNLVGGMPYRQQLKGLSRPVDIIVATPGRLLDHMENRRVDLSSIEMLILDEADRMLDMGFIEDVKQIAKAAPSKRQTLLFSATVDKKLVNIIKQLLKDPVRIDLSEKKISPVKIKQELYMADSVQHKNRLLQHFIKDGNIFKAIIFSATKINADKLTKQLHSEGHAVAALHGDLKQAVRNRTLEAMRRGKIQFLIATDVAARGIDIDDITHVINFDLPKFHEDYVHRIGRTGRAGRSGTAISFVLPEDGRHVQGIERYIGEKIAINAVAGLEASKSFNFNAPKKKQGGRRGRGRSFKNESARNDNFRNSSARNERSKGSHFKGDRTKSDKSHFRGDRPVKEAAGSKGTYARREEPRSNGFKKDGMKKEGFKSKGFKNDHAKRDGFKGKRFNESGFKREHFKANKPKKKFKARGE